MIIYLGLIAFIIGLMAFAKAVNNDNITTRREFKEAVKVNRKALRK